MKTECIIWDGPKWSKGRYGMDVIEGRCMGAHRAAWIRVNGPIENGLVVCHKCDNGLCVNVEHLFLGTMKDNMQDCKKKGRIILKSQSGSRNHNARPDYDFIKQKVKEMKNIGKSYREIKKELNIKSNGHVRALFLS